MKTFILSLLLVCLMSIPGMVSSSRSQDSAQADELFKKAMHEEWFGSATYKEIDELLNKSIELGNKHAFFMDAFHKIKFSESKDPNPEKYCPKLKDIVRDWEENSANDALSMYNISQFSMMKECGNFDKDKAIKYMAIAAEKGFPKAQLYYGNYLLRKQPNKGIEYIKKASEADLPEAQAHLGACYLQGKGIAKDINAGNALLEKALASKNQDTLRKVAAWYEYGQNGLEKNPEKVKEIDKMIKD